ncbi:MAG: diguanylate cyclase [Clostridiales Family XIII bacterium]|jgi:EAL and modified HD-GYP domain-containing signal transduction protein|nr:diguanylate cyclase [Clostridiales Family XIII bacterium]
MLFNRNKTQDLDVEQFLSCILDAQAAEIVVIGKKNEQILFMNALARERVGGSARSGQPFKTGYAKLFHGLYEICFEDAAKPADAARGANAGNPKAGSDRYSFEIKDSNDKLFSCDCNEIAWTGNRAALLLTLRDMSEENEVRDRLYSLAYTDQLTGVPNRAKLKDDFDAIREDIVNGELTGIIALFDLDNFKSINDTYGHNTGDVMLRRMTSMLDGDPAFAGHLYRLGGDEFVLLYYENTEKFQGEEDLSAHYGKLQGGALRTYTMPNIELSCTLSMGAAFFPKHGHAYADLLRKADIALYKAKAAGRNCLLFFEDQYDTAKKFKDLYINIQPILNGDRETAGYELIDKGNEDTDDESEMNLTEFDRTMDAVDLSMMENRLRYFISFSDHLLNTAVRSHLPKDKFVIQMRVSSEPGEKEMEKYSLLHSYGYDLAMTGLRNFDVSPELVKLAEYFKIDPMEADGASLQAFIKKHPKKNFIALNVNTSADFDGAKRQGFQYFQGFFFNEPQVLSKTKEIDPLRGNYLRLLQLTSADGYVDFEEISAADVAMSYKLLRLLNSAAVGLRNRISSIPMAVAMLGENNLKKWIATLALRGVTSGAPLELVRLSLIRARFAELLAPHFSPRRNPRHAFIVGMFSLLHIALEKNRQELFDEIPVADEIKESLLTEDGIYSDMLPFFNGYEYASWDEITEFAATHELSDQLISESYVEAVKWYNDLSSAENE